MIYLADGLPMNFNVPKLPRPMPISMLLPILPGPPRVSFLPLALLPYFNNQLNSAIISNALYKPRASTPPTFNLSEPENKTTVSTESPTAPTQSIINLPSPNPTIGSIPIAEVEQVIQSSTANPSSSVPSTSPTSLINPMGTVTLVYP
jgi:hypothetical protein